jgi:hypothetical protein
VLHFENDPTRIPVLQRAFRLNESILRYMVFRKERLPEGPTVTLEEEEAPREYDREYRGERRERDESADRFRKDREEEPKGPSPEGVAEA